MNVATVTKKFTSKFSLILILYAVLIGYASGFIQIKEITMLFKQPLFRMFGLIVILMSSVLDRGLALLLLVIYVLEVAKSSKEGFAPYSKEYEVSNPQTLVQPTNHIYPGCLDMTAEKLRNEFSGNKLSLQQTVRNGYNQLLKQIPKESSSAESLELLAKAVGLPFSVELSDETAPLIATMLMVQGFKFSESCQSPNKDIQNTPMKLLDGSVVSPNDTGDFFNL